MGDADEADEARGVDRVVGILELQIRAEMEGAVV